MPLSPDQLCSRLNLEGEKTVAFFSSLPEEFLNTEIYSEGESWSIGHVVRHLVQTEKAIQRLIDGILEGAAGVSEDFDLDEYNERKVRELESQGIEEVLAEFESARGHTIVWVSERTSQELALTGRHPFLGIAPIEAMVKLLYRHCQLHQRDVRRQLALGE